ncbi:MAG: enoyl-CoA hydratase/isomerase family protein [Chloroflexi bacterium]|nr:enoyl-CoA hydratase/isomerase family protein [Chloroflexota bacterium]
MGYEVVLTETRDRVRTIQLNRPEKLNALTDQLANEMIAAIEEADRDDEVLAILITGAGRGFCAGLDLTQPRTVGNEPSRWQRVDDFGWVGRQALVITGASKPVVAAINGAAAGAGLSIALAADVRVMTAGARITTGYARRGLCPDGGMSWFLPRIVGATRAADLILTARDITADEALQSGIVAAVYPDESFREDAHAYAARLAANAPIGMTHSKRLLASTFTNSLPTQLRQELTLIRRCFETEDVKESMKAFAEKRQPTFSGR